MAPSPNTEILHRLLALLAEDGSLSVNSKRAYRTDLRQFGEWCNHHSILMAPVDAETIFRLIAERKQAGLKPGTIDREARVITWAHRMLGHTSPTEHPEVRRQLSVLRREMKETTVAKEPLKLPELRQVLDAMSGNRLGTRDRAMLLLSFTGEFYPSELTALTVADLTMSFDGMTAYRHRPNHGMRGESGPIWIDCGQWPETDPVQAMREWLKVRGLADGPLFCAIDRHGNLSRTRMSERALQLILTRAAGKAGLDRNRFATSSLRRGLKATAQTFRVNEFRAIEPRQYHLERKAKTPALPVSGRNEGEVERRPKLDAPAVRRDLIKWINKGYREASQLDLMLGAKYDCEPSTAAGWRRKLGFVSVGGSIIIPKGE